MSIARLSAGAGYRYLLRSIALDDLTRVPVRELSAYYAASGNPPGRWLGAGLPGLGSGDGRDLTAGTTVTEEAMARLYGSGHDPVTGERLGLAYPKFKTAAERIAARVARLPESLSEMDRADAVTQIEAQEDARPVRSAVAGYDLTFTVPKSVSVVWALSDPEIQAAVEGAHHEAVGAVLALIEERFLHTRIGSGSKIRVPAHGAIADLLAQRLPVRFNYRDRGPRRTPGYELDGIGDELLTAFSSRSTEIGAQPQDLVAVFTDTHGREPNRVETIRLRQQATLATRPDKELTPLAELRVRWRASAEAVTGQPAASVVRAALTSANAGVSSIVTTAPSTDSSTLTPTAVPDALLARYAEAAVAAVSTRRATWTQVNLLAEAARTTRALRLPGPASRIALLDRVLCAALERCIALDPPESVVPAAAASERYTRTVQIGASADAPEPAFTTWTILAAEARLLAAHQDTTAATADPRAVEAFLAAPVMPGAPRLSTEQARACGAIAGSGRRLDVLIGPAGAGKTRALWALRVAWEQTHGSGTVIGLAPSATAAAQLAASLRIGADTLAKWIHESDPDTAGEQPWRLLPGQLVILDEAAMAPTSNQASSAKPNVARAAGERCASTRASRRVRILSTSASSRVEAVR